MEDGGIALSADFQKAMSMTGSADESLIDTEYSYTAALGKGNSDGWSEQRTKSWHTKSNAASSTNSGFNPNAYRRSTTSIAGTSHSFASSVAERSDTSEIRPNGWAKIRAAPRGPPMVCFVLIAQRIKILFSKHFEPWLVAKTHANCVIDAYG
jgi:DNA repair protein RAD7